MPWQDGQGADVRFSPTNPCARVFNPRKGNSCFESELFLETAEKETSALRRAKAVVARADGCLDRYGYAVSLDYACVLLLGPVGRRTKVIGHLEQEILSVERPPEKELVLRAFEV